MVFITGHCPSFDIQIMYVPRKLNKLNNFKSVKINISDKHFQLLLILFETYLKNEILDYIS